MSKIDLQGLSIIYHIRIDTQERLRNLELSTQFYVKNCKNFHFYFCEDSDLSRFGVKLNNNECSWLTPDIYTYRFYQNTDHWKKWVGFNWGLQQSKTNYVCFHDVDTIVHPQQLVKGIEWIKSEPNSGLIYPYNGMFLCVSQAVKDSFYNTHNYGELDIVFNKLPERSRLYPNYLIPDVLVGHTSSIGGCVMANKENFIKCGMYNPNFKGWGYEDSEIAPRVNILGYEVTRLNGNNEVLWHFPHTGEGQSEKETNSHHENNKQECLKVEHMSCEQLGKYIKSWQYE